MGLCNILNSSQPNPGRDLLSHPVNQLDFSLHCSFSDVTTEAIEFDTYKLAIGFGLMFCYTMFMLGKLNVVEHRTYLAMTGQVYTEQNHQLSELIQVWLVVELILMNDPLEPFIKYVRNEGGGGVDRR